MKQIKAEEKITSGIFYEKMLPRILEAVDGMESGEDFIMDLSRTASVDAMAVPLLLNTARWIIGEKGTVPQIYIPNLEEKDALKRYLDMVGFFNICDFYDYYEVNADRKSVKMDRRNLATYVLTENAKNDSQKERERIEEYAFRKLIDGGDNSYQLFWEYWKAFDDAKNVNIVEEAVRTICVNVGIHTKEDAILTLQRNKTLGRVCISIADCGQGLYATLSNKEGFQPASISFQKFKELKGDEADMYAIAEAVSYRFAEREYGLYHVLMKLLKLAKEKEEQKEEWNWRLRIHTNQKRVVFTGNNCKELSAISTKEQFAKRIIMLAGKKYVAELTPYYPGVHIEIEIPYDKEKV